jgi:hypothetical protein
MNQASTDTKPKLAAKTNAQYQAEYRARVQAGLGRRFSLVMSNEANDALHALAEKKSSSQRAILESLILAATTEPVPTPASQTFADRYREHRIDAQASLSETALQKLERFMKKESGLLAELWNDKIIETKQRLHKEFEASMPERMEALAENEKRLSREIEKYQSLNMGFMSQEEYKLVKGVCHPDREAPTERKNKAFIIIERMEKMFTGRWTKPANKFSS